MTVGELRAALVGLPDDTEIVVWHDPSMQEEPASPSDPAMGVTDVRNDGGAFHIVICS